MLSALRKRRIRCAVYSNKAHDFTVKIVNHFFGNSLFEAILGGGKFPPKPDPAGAIHIESTMGLGPSDFLYVGDSDIDMQTARNAGIYSAGVTWGFRSREELAQNGAKALIDRPAELISLLDEP
jgi:phosphoglycolate phosphatase